MVRRRAAGLALVLASASLVPIVSPHAQSGREMCGVERWSVKILADRDSGRVDFRPVPTTIAILTRLPRPTGGDRGEDRVSLERRTVRVRAILRSQHLSGDDRDIHLVLADPAAPEVTLVGEVPDSICAVGVPHASTYAAIRRALSRIADGTEVEVEGVLFFDRAHGQRGLAPNAIEIHPILRLAPVERFGTSRRSAAATRSVPADTSTVRVWINQQSNTYHCPSSDQYGRTRVGAFMTEAEARRRLGQPRGGIPCSRP